MEQLDLTLARTRRDDALNLVSSHNDTWTVRAMTKLKEMRVNAQHQGFSGSFTGEDIRTELSRVVGPPKHHNAWGALVNHAVRGKLIVKTGEYRQMMSATSHARATPVYRWVVTVPSISLREHGSDAEW